MAPPPLTRNSRAVTDGDRSNNERTAAQDPRVPRAIENDARRLADCVASGPRHRKSSDQPTHRPQHPPRASGSGAPSHDVSAATEDFIRSLSPTAAERYRQQAIEVQKRWGLQQNPLASRPSRQSQLDQRRQPADRKEDKRQSRDGPHPSWQLREKAKFPSRKVSGPAHVKSPDSSVPGNEVTAQVPTLGMQGGHTTVPPAGNDLLPPGNKTVISPQPEALEELNKADSKPESDSHDVGMNGPDDNKNDLIADNPRGGDPDDDDDASDHDDADDSSDDGLDGDSSEALGQSNPQYGDKEPTQDPKTDDDGGLKSSTLDGRGKGENAEENPDSDSDVLMRDSDSQQWVRTEHLLKQQYADAAKGRAWTAGEETRLQRLATRNDLFAPFMLRIIEKFRECSAARDWVKKDPLLLDPSSTYVVLTGGVDLHQMDLANCFSIEPEAPGREFSDAWFCEETLSNMIRLGLEGATPDPNAYFADPVQLRTFLSTSVDRNLMVARLSSVITKYGQTGLMPVDGGVRLPVPCEDMPVTAKYIVLPFNVGDHWVSVKIQPDLHTRKGQIALVDSLPHPGHARVVLDVIPLFAELMGLRPTLDWRQESWTLVNATSTVQNKWTDCGPITGSNCIQLMKGEDPILHAALERTVGDFGKQLRYEYLRLFYPQMMAEPIPSSGSSKTRAAMSPKSESGKEAQNRQPQWLTLI